MKTYLLFAGLCLIGLTIRTGYEWLKKAGRVDTNNKAIFAMVFMAMCFMLASWPTMCPRDPWRIAFPGILHTIGIVTVIAGLALAIGGLIQLRGLENIDHLVTTGLYSRIRHPMYMGFILWIVGWVVCYGAIVSLVVGLVCIANILYWGHLEERALEVQFGQDYRDFSRKTYRV